MSAKKEEKHDGWVEGTKTYTFTENTIRDDAIADYKKRLIEKLEKHVGWSVPPLTQMERAIKLVEETE